MGQMVEKYKPNGYIKTLMALTSLIIAAAVFSLLRTPNAYTYLTMGGWLALNFKFGYTRWMKNG